MGNSLCRKRNVQATESKNPMDRIFGRLQICPNGLSRRDNIQVEKSSNIYQVPSWPSRRESAPVAPPRSSPPKTNTSGTQLNAEWTEVPLRTPPGKTPPPPPMLQKNAVILQQSSATPVPPPRKHRRGLKQILDRMSSTENRVPVEEPIIVPKKEIIHICDPTKHPHHYHKTADGVRKAHSTIVPPVYNDLDVKKETVKNGRRASIPRNSSLPGEAGLSLSQATAQRLESYMTRCRSFGSLLPQQIIDKIKNTPSTNTAGAGDNDRSDAESEDSWGGLDDWDLGVIEHDGVQDGPPVTPNSRLPSKKRPAMDVQFTIGNDKTLQTTQLSSSISKDAKTHESIDKLLPTTLQDSKPVDLQSVLSNAPSIVITDSSEDHYLSHDVKPKQAPLARRESIEDVVDWFDKEDDPAQNYLDNAANKMSTEITSHSNILHDGPTNPFRTYDEDASFKSDAFFTSKFLEYEKVANMTDERRQKVKATNIRNTDISDSKNMTENFIDENHWRKELGISTNLDIDSPKESPQKDIYKNTNAYVNANESRTNDSKLSNKSGENIGHSNLLKFFHVDTDHFKDIEDSAEVDESAKIHNRNNAKVDISGFHST